MGSFQPPPGTVSSGGAAASPSSGAAGSGLGEPLPGVAVGVASAVAVGAGTTGGAAVGVGAGAGATVAAPKVTRIAELPGLTLPAASCCTARRSYEPFAMPDPVHDQVPPDTTALQTE
ncbi:hypothetical protein C3B59_01820 [Cryobacterium zongtaii]|uniref:Uncharacterized protein n=1 Tax=Cryobacterium zongtaii TaxID=1259217 RepID=A0A2S3ZQ44_9MICO|nr:hypothetical protein C3B59_01820 [Cryobacterium zongtaii]